MLKRPAPPIRPPPQKFARSVAWGGGRARPAAPVSFEDAVLGLAPSSGYEAALAEALREVDSRLKQVFGEEVAAFAFGSIIQSAHLEGSDLDLCFDVPGEDMFEEVNGKADNTKQVAALRRLLGALKGKFRVIETRLWKNMKVPIIVVGYRSGSGVEVEADISVGTIFEDVEKGFADRCIRRLCAMCPKALHLVRIIKLWAKVERVNKAYDGFLNSLGWTLLALYFLMERSELSCGDIDIEEPDERGLGADPSQLPPLLHADEARGGVLSVEEQQAQLPLPSELADFFDWVASWETWWPPQEPPNDPHRDRMVWGMSLVEGSIVGVPPPAKSWPDSSALFIEDPGVRMVKGVSENVARSLKVATWSQSMRKCAEAAASIRGGAGDASPESARDWLAGLLARNAGGPEAPGFSLVAALAGVRPSAKGAVRPLWQAAPRAPAMWRPAPKAGVVPRAPVWRPTPKAGVVQAPRPSSALAWPLAAKRPRPGVCAWFLKNECWDGDNCRNSHAVA